MDDDDEALRQAIALSLLDAEPVTEDRTNEEIAHKLKDDETNNDEALARALEAELRYEFFLFVFCLVCVLKNKQSAR
jgi:hypothetical protein